MGELREHRSLPRIEPTSFGRDYHLVKAGIPETERERYLISINEIAAFYRRKKPPLLCFRRAGEVFLVR